MPEETPDLDAIERGAREAIARAETPQSLRETRARILGRKGSLSAVLRALAELPAEQRATVGAAANALKQQVEAWVGDRQSELERGLQRAELAGHSLDATLPGASLRRGALNPVTVVERDMVEFFRGLGFSVEEGPEVESDYNNFEALNFPPDHPARDMHDTFFVEGGAVLRTHTSPVQIRAMQGREPPFRFIAPGRVFRTDHGSTKSPIFHQIEGFLVDQDVTFADLKGVLYAFARHLMGSDIPLRFRASFFPFTEPSAEMDFWWNDQWLEWGGCGMIHPRVLENVGVDPARYRGFAFGMGIDRTAMLRYGIPNIQALFDSDVRIREQL